MDISNNTAKLICRKCGGGHLTIKCGKEAQTSVLKSKLEEGPPAKPFYKEKYNDKDIDGNKRERFNRRPLHKVKISNLPVDMNDEELMELLYDWGHVIKLRVLNYTENSTAYVEFKEEAEANYLVEALHKTPFESIIIHVERIFD